MFGDPIRVPVPDDFSPSDVRKSVTRDLRLPAMCQTMVAMELLELAASASSASASWLNALWYYPTRHSLGAALLKAWRNCRRARVGKRLKSRPRPAIFERLPE